jgi:uncharacterized membrane protein YgdD (TMEM256/DUF423 family)
MIFAQRTIMKTSKFWILVAGISGFIGVTLGAFGAHGLKDILSSEMMEVYETGVFYHLIHTLSIFMIGLSAKEQFFKAALFFLTGIILFSFSLFAYSITELRFLVFVTPLGGISFLIGWILIVIGAIRKKTDG